MFWHLCRTFEIYRLISALYVYYFHQFLLPRQQIMSNLLVGKVTVYIHLHTRASTVRDSSVPTDASCRGQ